MSCDNHYLYWFLWFYGSIDKPASLHSFLAFAYWSSNDSTGCYGRGFTVSLCLCLLIIDSKAFFLSYRPHTHPARTKLSKMKITIRLVTHAVSLYQRKYCSFCFLLRIKDDVAWRVIDPFNLKMWINFEIISNHLVAHIIHSKQMPWMIPQLDIIFSEVRNLSFIKKL